MCRNINENIISDLIIKKYYNEADVREEFMSFLLKILGYKHETIDYVGDIHREFNAWKGYQIGKEKIKTKYSDYVISLGTEPRVLVVETKSPDENPLGKECVEQAYSYAVCPDIRAYYFITSNANNTYVFDTEEYTSTRTSGIKPKIFIPLNDLKNKFKDLAEMISKKNIEKRVNLRTNFRLCEDSYLRIENYYKNEQIRNAVVKIIKCEFINSRLSFELDLCGNIFPYGMWLKVYRNQNIENEIGSFIFNSDNINNPILVNMEFSDNIDIIELLEFNAENVNIKTGVDLYAKPFIPEKEKCRYDTMISLIHTE